MNFAGPVTAAVTPDPSAFCCSANGVQARALTVRRLRGADGARLHLHEEAGLGPVEQLRRRHFLALFVARLAQTTIGGTRHVERVGRVHLELLRLPAFGARGGRREAHLSRDANHHCELELVHGVTFPFSSSIRRSPLERRDLISLVRPSAKPVPRRKHRRSGGSVCLRGGFSHQFGGPVPCQRSLNAVGKTQRSALRRRDLVVFEEVRRSGRGTGRSSHV